MSNVPNDSVEEDGRLPTGKLPSAIGKNHRIAVVDTHFHLWKSQEIAPPSGIMADPSLFRDFDWSDYELAMQGVALEAAIHVQVHHGSEKAKSEYGRVERFAAEHAPIAGMIAWAPLESPGVEREIAELAQSPLVAGVRRLTQQEPDECFAQGRSSSQEQNCSLRTDWFARSACWNINSKV